MKNFPFQASGRSATKRISLPMVPATRQCATWTGDVLSRVAVTATASVIFTSVRCCFCTAAQLAAARWACAVLAMVASSAEEQASLWIMVEATVRGWERVACERPRGEIVNVSVERSANQTLLVDVRSHQLRAPTEWPRGRAIS